MYQHTSFYFCELKMNHILNTPYPLSYSLLFIFFLLIFIIFIFYLFINNFKKKYTTIETQNCELHKQIDIFKIDNTELVKQINLLENQNTDKLYNIKYLKDSIRVLEEKQAYLKLIEDNNAKIFEHLSRKIIEENNKKFNDLAKEKIDTSLSPVKIQFDDLKKHIFDLKKEQTEHTVTLKEQVNYVTRKADNLSKILKVDTKFHGSWGEFQLERLLEISGLVKGRDYTTETYVDEANRDRIDVIIYLPEGKHIMIDSKVSLIAYEKYLSSEKDILLQEIHLKELKNNIKKQIDSLHSKAYNQSTKYESVEYTIMFIPIESAYILAFNDISLNEYAWSKNVIPIAPSNLYPTLKTIASIIALEKRKKSVAEIISLAEKMLNRLQSVYEDVNKASNQLDTVHKTLTNIKNSLQDGRGTILSNAQKMIQKGQLNTTFKETIKSHADEDLINSSDEVFIQDPISENE